MARTVVVFLAVAMLLGVASANAAVRKVSFTSSVAANSYASLTVKVSPKSRCTIKVVYETVVSSAKGLGPKSGTTITWRWKVGSATHAGRWR